MAIILFPVGRMIGGSLEKLTARTEQDGKTPKLDKAGQPLMVCNFGVAIPKTQADWRNEPWGAQMFEIGKAAEPVLHQSPAFAWKIIDGDDKLPNKNGKVPAMQTGYAGNWVLWFSQGWLPTQCNADGSMELPPGSIHAGQYVQVQGDIASNGAKPPNTPGLYLNPKAVALAADGERITTEKVDTTAVGFGAAPLPAGAKPLEAAVPGFAPTATLGGAALAATGAPVPPPVAVPPSTAFMTPPPVPTGPTMTAKAAGVTRESFLAQGWTDALLVEHGYMVM